MTGNSTNLQKMFRWLKDKKKNKTDKKSGSAEDDYGFRKKQIILQESENGHSVIIKDDETTLVYPQSFCRFNYRARMPTPVQNVTETSTHIYDEIPEIPVRTRLEMDLNQNEADIIKDTKRDIENPVDLRNAIEVGPYLIVPLVNPTTSKSDVEIFKRNDDTFEKDLSRCRCEPTELCNCHSKTEYSPPWDEKNKKSIDSSGLIDTKVVLTRCVKSKTGLNASENVQPVCSLVNKTESDMCSFENGARTLMESPGADSNSRTLTGTPDSSTRTPDSLSERHDSCAITDGPDDIEICRRTPAETADGNETCCEYDLSTSGESDQSGVSDYELYLSKIENNLKLKHNVRKLVKTIENTIHENDEEHINDGDIEVDTMTYVSSLSEYSSADSHISDVSADRSASDDSSGYYECSDEIQGSHNSKRDSRVNLERSVSAPESSTAKYKLSNGNRKYKDKVHIKNKKYKNERSNSFDSNIYKALSDEDKEMYLFPSSNKSNASSSTSSKKSRSKPVLTPQPTPVYMDPYRGKSRSHNRLLGDLIRMNYDKQLFIH